VTHGLAVFNVGICRLLRGEPEQALALIDRAIESGWIETWTMRRARHVLYGGRAFCLAVLGRLEEAQRDQDRALHTCPTAQRGTLVSGDALLVARAGQHAALLDACPEWAQLAAQSGRPPQQRTLAVLKALALQATGAEGSAVSEALAEAPALDPGRVDHLAVRWPALAEFLQERQLAARADS